MDHSAEDSYLGYRFQGLYALVLLLDSSDDQSVSIETFDDVVLEGCDPTLHQLKHSIGTPQPLTVKSAGLWKTIRIWSELADLYKYRFVLATSAQVQSEDEIAALCDESADRAGAVTSLEAEATRVIEAVQQAKASNSTIPFADKHPGCYAFMALDSQNRTELVRRISVRPASFNIADVPREVEKRLSPSTLPAARAVIVERIIEWWDRRVCRGLLDDLPRSISKGELQTQIVALILEYQDSCPHNDFGDLLPQPDELLAVGNLRNQVELVRGGESRVHRSARERWRARSQRQRWMEEDISLHSLLSILDTRILEAWGDLHGPMREDYKDVCEDAQCAAGLRMLDWAHDGAHQQVQPIHPKWTAPFLVRGTLQQFADELKVGWHPDYMQRLGKTADQEDSD